jgi:hypothetical protein
MSDLEKTATAYDDQKYGSGRVDIQEVGEVDLRAYHFTEEESRAITRKYDWRVRLQSRDMDVN